MGDYIGYSKLGLAHSHLLLKLTYPIHYISFGKLGLAIISVKDELLRIGKE